MADVPELIEHAGVAPSATETSYVVSVEASTNMAEEPVGSLWLPKVLKNVI
jgi:hypothetical protein